MRLEVEPVEVAAGPDGGGGVTEEHAGAAEAVEALLRRAAPVLQRVPEGVAEVRVAGEGLGQAPQVVAEGAALQGRADFKLGERQAVGGQAMQPAPRQVRMPADQCDEARDLGGSLEAFKPSSTGLPPPSGSVPWRKVDLLM